MDVSKVVEQINDIEKKIERSKIQKEFCQKELKQLKEEKEEIEKKCKEMFNCDIKNISSLIEKTKKELEDNIQEIMELIQNLEKDINGTIN